MSVRAPLVVMTDVERLNKSTSDLIESELKGLEKQEDGSLVVCFMDLFPEYKPEDIKQGQTVKDLWPGLYKYIETSPAALAFAQGRASPSQFDCISSTVHSIRDVQFLAIQNCGVYFNYYFKRIPLLDPSKPVQLVGVIPPDSDKLIKFDNNPNAKAFHTSLWWLLATLANVRPHQGAVAGITGLDSKLKDSDAGGIQKTAAVQKKLLDQTSSTVVFGLLLSTIMLQVAKIETFVQVVAHPPPLSNLSEPTKHDKLSRTRVWRKSVRPGDNISHEYVTPPKSAIDEFDAIADRLQKTGLKDGAEGLLKLFGRMKV